MECSLLWSSLRLLSFFLSQLSKEVAGLNMNFPLQVRPDVSEVFVVIVRITHFYKIKSPEPLFAFVSIFVLFFFSLPGLNARYESKHPAVHVPSQPHGQGWSLWQPRGEDEEETALDAALWSQHLRYVTSPAFNCWFHGFLNTSPTQNITDQLTYIS